MMTDALRTQRLGAYAVVIDGDSLLLTRISPVGYPAGTWTLPGGGVDHGESPRSAVIRELHEETGLTATSVRLVDVHDVHVVELGRGDRFEDYHGVHLLFAATVAAVGPVRVIDEDGTTDLAAWVRLAEVGDLPVLPVVTHVLENLADYEALGVTVKKQ